jgi:hypothetical protein
LTFKVATHEVAWADDEMSFRGLVDRHQLTFPQLADRDGTLYEHSAIPAQPAFVVINPDGDATIILGGLDEAELEAALADATTAT